MEATVTTPDKMLNKLRASRAKTQAQLASVAEAQMTLPLPRRQTPADVRSLYYRLIAHEVEHTVHLIKTLDALGIRQTEAQLILRDLQETRGKLEGLLVGLSDADLDRQPEGEAWPLRRVLEHIIETEEMYTGRILEGLKEGAAPS